MTSEWDALVIGGGFAGLSAAQMLGRSRRRTLVIDGGAPRNRFSSRMHGVLGHDGLDPAELLERGRAEARAYGVRIEAGDVMSLVDEGDALRIVRRDGTVDRARVAVIATGVRDQLPDVPGLDAGWGRTVLHCPYCHGWEVADRRLAVLTTSPESLHQVELVRQLSPDVTAFTAGAEPLEPEAQARLVARGIRIVSSAVHEVRQAPGSLVLVDADGAEHVADAVFTAGSPVVDIGFAAALDLTRADLPGAPLSTDQRGATSHPRVFAAGNVTAPYANVPVAMGAGSMAGAGANAALVALDVAEAVDERTVARNTAWETRYAAEDRVWSGRVNATMAAVVDALQPGTALDVGSGEGGDVVWLAERGWRVTGVDVSPTAVRRASELARARGVEAEFVVGDGAAAVADEFDLVVASFLHSWEPDFPRIRMLRDAASRVAAGGHLLVVSHAAPPPWASERHDHAPVMRAPEEELAMLGLDREVWEPERVEVRSRATVAPDGSPAQLDDGILLVRRMR